MSVSSGGVEVLKLSSEGSTFSRPRTRSTPSPIQKYTKGKEIGTYYGDSAKSSGGIEFTVYGTKSCESIRHHRSKELAVTRQILYKEALYTGTHMLGKPTQRFPSNQEDILTYVQITFAHNVQEQIDFIQYVTGEPFPLTIVNIGIRRAEHLAARDKNGLSDPYCLISVETEESVDKSLWKTLDFGSPRRPKSVKHSKERERPIAEKRYDQQYNTVPRSIRTTIEHQTLHPVWEQRFQCLALRPSHDILHVEVWDHDDEKEVTNAIQTATDAQKTERLEEGMGLVEGFRKGKRDDFIGKTMTKISEIPVEGEEKWYYLHGKTHRGQEAQGKLLMQIWLTHSFRHGIHYKAYASPRAILEKMWDYILEVESQKHKTNQPWNGEIPIAATCLLFQYGLQSGMSESAQAIIRFNAYAKRHLQMHGTELRLKELDTCIKKYEGLSEESRLSGKLSHCDHQEMIISLFNSLHVPFAVIRHHLKEKQEKIDEALKSYRYVLSIFERVGSPEEIKILNFELMGSLRIGVLEWYQETFLEIVRGSPTQSPLEVICSLAKVMRSVKEKLYQGQKTWTATFWMEGNLDYLPTIFDEFQKMIIHDVEAVTWSLLRNYNDNDFLRKILLRISPEHKAICRCLFDLYIETQQFVHFQSQIFPKENLERSVYPHLDEYHRWFRPVLVLWLGFAFIRAHELISNCIEVDEVSSDKYILTSSSAVDTVVIFHQLESFKHELNWPDPAENCVVTMFIVEVIGYMSILYASLKRRKIDREGYFDTVDRFDISERLCRALNNIQYVQETVQSTTHDLQIDKLLEDLEKTVGKGSEALGNSHQRILDFLSTALVEIEKEIQMIVSGISDRVRLEIRSAWEECLVRLQHNVNSHDHLDPIYNYLEGNLRTLHEFLVHANFVRIVQMFWIVICQELVTASANFPSTTTLEQRTYFESLQNLLPALIDYLKGNGEGITETQVNCPDFDFAHKYLQMFTVDSDMLKAIFFMERAKEQIDLKEPKQFGTLQVRVAFWNGKLSVQIISARDLLPMDHPSKIWEICRKISPPSSDPQVQIEIILNGGFREIKAQKTRLEKQTLNPTFNETFDFLLDHDVCQSPYSVIRFTVRDVDLLSRNEFLGEALLPISMMPGIAFAKPIPQPMNLQLRSTDKYTKNPYLLVLKSRSWEPDAQQFVSSQFSRIVNTSSES